MSLEWTQDLSVGVEEIDSQHKELFSRINNLHAAIHQGRGRDEIGRLIKFLDDYVVTHFGAEEKYMTKYDYPGYPLHKEQHTWFIKELSDIRSRLETDGPTVYLTIRSNQLLSDWLINHIKKVDKSLGVFLKARL